MCHKDPQKHFLLCENGPRRGGTVSNSWGGTETNSQKAKKVVQKLNLQHICIYACIYLDLNIDIDIERKRERSRERNEQTT